MRRCLFRWGSISDSRDHHAQPFLFHNLSPAVPGILSPTATNMRGTLSSTLLLAAVASASKTVPTVWLNQVRSLSHSSRLHLTRLAVLFLLMGSGYAALAPETRRSVHIVAVGAALPTPVTKQCDVLPISWSRGAARGCVRLDPDQHNMLTFAQRRPDPQ